MWNKKLKILKIKLKNLVINLITLKKSFQISLILKNEITILTTINITFNNIKNKYMIIIICKYLAFSILFIIFKKYIYYIYLKF